MPRTLPWLVEARKTQLRTSTASSSPAPPAKKRKTTPKSDEDVLDDNLDPVAPSTPKTRITKQGTPPTSSPPAPPDVEHMREGWAQDDAWMMVEDEFLATARMFTSHIHHAEYVRLKKLARSRGDGALGRIARPVDGRAAKSAGLKLREEAAVQAQAVEEEQGKVGDAGDAEEEPWRHDAQLAELMSGLGRERRDLSGLVRGSQGARKAVRRRSSTPPERDETINKAETGTSRRSIALGSEDTTDDDDDDLDAPVLKSQQPSIKPQASRHTLFPKRDSGVNREKENKRPSAGKEDSLPVVKGFAKPKEVAKPRPAPAAAPLVSSRRPEKPTIIKSEDDSGIKKEKKDVDSPTIDLDDLMPARSQRSSDASAFLAKRKAERERKQREREGMEKGKVKTEPGTGVPEMPPFWMP